MLPQIGVNGQAGGKAANDQRWANEFELGEMQALVSRVDQLQREIREFTLYHDPLNTALAFDQIYNRTVEIEWLTAKIRQRMSAAWVELITAIREER